MCIPLLDCDHFSQLTIPGFEYTARTFSQNKKDAETAAAKDFCGYLIGAGLIPAESLPDSVFVSMIILSPVRDLNTINIYIIYIYTIYIYILYIYCIFSSYKHYAI